VIQDPVFGYQGVNVEAQLRHKTSLLEWVKLMIRVRKKTPAFALGSVKFHHPPNKKVLCFERIWDNERVLVVCNLSRFSQPAEIPLPGLEGHTPVEMIGDTAFPVVTDKPYQLSLGPFMFLWFRMEKRPVPKE
jgi:maltose alpha-D-glucosyltransferase/alpha-amylase